MGDLTVSDILSWLAADDSRIGELFYWWNEACLDEWDDGIIEWLHGGPAEGELAVAARTAALYARSHETRNG